MILQQAIDQLEEQLAGALDVPSQNVEELHLRLSLWNVLQKFARLFPSLRLLPVVERENWSCDAILLSQGGIYVFHLIPPWVSEMEISSAGIHVLTGSNEPSHAFVYSFGKSCKILDKIQHQLGTGFLPVYEFYIATDQHQNIKMVVEGKLMISISQLEELFKNYDFRSNPEMEKYQQELYESLLRPVEPVADMDNPIHSMPPRQSRKKKHHSSWLNKLFHSK